MTRRMTRAQRAAVGPQGGKPLAQPLDFTIAQRERIHRLKADFGAGNVGTPRQLHGTTNMIVPLKNAVGTAQWLFDEDGKYLTRYAQRALFDDIITDSTA